MEPIRDEFKKHLRKNGYGFDDAISKRPRIWNIWKVSDGIEDGYTVNVHWHNLKLEVNDDLRETMWWWFDFSKNTIHKVDFFVFLPGQGYSFICIPRDDMQIIVGNKCHYPSNYDTKKVVFNFRMLNGCIFKGGPRELDADRYYKNLIQPLEDIEKELFKVDERYPSFEEQLKLAS